MTRRAKANKSFRRRILLVLLGLFLFYSIWLSVRIASYKKWGETASIGAKAAPSARTGSSPFFHEIRGVYHIHTRHSDGSATAARIVGIAASIPLDFIVITDHGNPNRASLAEEGWKGKLLVLAGSELSSSRGHLVALDFNSPRRPFAQNADDASREIASLGGFSVIAHPFSKVQWSWGEFAEYGGLEIIDADTMIRKNLVPSIPYIPALFLRPGYFLLRILDPPVKTLRKWEELNEIRPVPGYFSADAHFLYGPVLRLFHLHVLLDRPLEADFKTAKDQVLDALRKGAFYNAVEAAAGASGFRFWAEKDGTVFPMGSILPAVDPAVPKSSAPTSSLLTIKARAPFPFAKEMRFIYNGKTLFTTRNDEMSLIPLRRGAFRVEVYLREKTPLRRDVPWIISNPIFIEKDRP